MNEHNAILPVKSIIRIALGVLGLLLIPLVAMQFTSEVNWTLSDFVVMGGLLLAVGLMLDVVLRKAGKYRALGALVVVVLFLWLWAELAVGVFTNWGN